MAIRVLKSGKTKNQKPYTVKCSNCRCEFSFERADVNITNDSRDGDYVTAPCPECNKGASVAFELTGWDH